MNKTEVVSVILFLLVIGLLFVCSYDGKKQGELKQKVIAKNLGLMEFNKKTLKFEYIDISNYKKIK